jgi:hypothetical protein
MGVIGGMGITGLRGPRGGGFHGGGGAMTVAPGEHGGTEGGGGQERGGHFVGTGDGEHGRETEAGDWEGSSEKPYHGRLREGKLILKARCRQTRRDAGHFPK